MKNLLSIEETTRIAKICKRLGIAKYRYKINSDGSINVNRDVYIPYDKHEHSIPIKFNKINGNFYCSSINLTTLVNAPSEVVGDFFCNYNMLTSLVGGPNKVHGSYYCNGNPLGNLEGCPQEIGKHFNCEDTHLTNLDFLPNKLGGDFYFDTNEFDDPIYNVSDEENDIFNKFKEHYEVWEPELSMENFKGLLVDIKEGLK